MDNSTNMAKLHGEVEVLKTASDHMFLIFMGILIFSKYAIEVLKEYRMPDFFNDQLILNWSKLNISFEKTKDFKKIISALLCYLSMEK